MAASIEERAKRKEDCVRQGLVAGGKGALWGFLGGAAAVGSANHFSQGFRNSLGVSGKTALVVSPAFLLYFLLSELAVNECARQQRFQHDAGLPGDILQRRRA